jgi:hypothetical protein
MTGSWTRNKKGITVVEQCGGPAEASERLVKDK